MKVSVYTLGCKVNQYESQAITEKLGELGIEASTCNKNADVCIINTCTVTSESDRKSRQTVRRAISENPDALVIVMGCSSQIDPDSFGRIEGVDFVLGNTSKTDACTIVAEYLKTGSKSISGFENVSPIDGADFEPMCIKRSERTRAYVKIEDGCESRCAYCIIPKARGKIRSKPINDVLNEVEGLVNGGYSEIVLTGIEISAYGKGCDFDLATLLEALDTERFDKLERIRLGSLDPSFLTPKTVDSLIKCKKLCHHFHLSLQSGSDRILALMRRRYNTSMVSEYVKYIRQVMSDVCFTADVIVGFPSETEEDILSTREFLQNIGLIHCHLFCYSRRPGTEADKMKGQIDSATKTRRLHKLRTTVESTAKSVLESFVGRSFPVLFEEFENGRALGHTDFFAEVSVLCDKDLRGQIFDVTVTAVHGTVLVARLDCTDCIN